LSRLLRRTLYGVAAGVVLYVAATIWFGVDDVAETLVGYPWSVFGIALAASSVNYLIRFAKWELALRWLEIRKDAPDLSRGRSLLVYLAGLSMSITPGKLGEVLRSVLLRATDGVPFARSAPIVLADRLTDLVALVILSLVGVWQFPEYLPIVLVTVVLVVAMVVVLGSPRMLRRVLALLGRLPGARRLTDRVEPLVQSTAVILRIRGLVLLSMLSVVGWGLECVGFWLILDAFSEVDASLALCTFLWAAGTLVGALSFLPGGLLATEGSLVVATQTLLVGVTQPIALAATLLARIATLWFGELVGGVALALVLRDPRIRAKTQELTPAG
jgi:glycosyltransferase 2 family protein